MDPHFKLLPKFVFEPSTDGYKLYRTKLLIFFFFLYRIIGYQQICCK